MSDLFAIPDLSGIPDPSILAALFTCGCEDLSPGPGGNAKASGVVAQAGGHSGAVSSSTFSSFLHDFGLSSRVASPNVKGSRLFVFYLWREIKDRWFEDWCFVAWSLQPGKSVSGPTSTKRLTKNRPGLRPQALHFELDSTYNFLVLLLSFPMLVFYLLVAVFCKH